MFTNQCEDCGEKFTQSVRVCPKCGSNEEDTILLANALTKMSDEFIKIKKMIHDKEDQKEIEDILDRISNFHRRQLEKVVKI